MGQEITSEQLLKLEEIAQSIGCTIDVLLNVGKSNGKSIDTIIEEYEQKKLKILNEG